MLHIDPWLTSGVKTQPLYAHLFKIQIYSPAENASQIKLLFKSSQRVISFASKYSLAHLGHTHQPKTIFLIFSNHIWLSPLAIFQRVTSLYIRGHCSVFSTDNLFSGKIITIGFFTLNNPNSCEVSYIYDILKNKLTLLHKNQFTSSLKHKETHRESQQEFIIYYCLKYLLFHPVVKIMVVQIEKKKK